MKRLCTSEQFHRALGRSGATELLHAATTSEQFTKPLSNHTESRRAGEPVRELESGRGEAPKVGGPNPEKERAKKGGAAKSGSQQFRAFHFSHRKFHPFVFPLLGSFRGFVCVGCLKDVDHRVKAPSRFFIWICRFVFERREVP